MIQGMDHMLKLQLCYLPAFVDSTKKNNNRHPNNLRLMTSTRPAAWMPKLAKAYARVSNYCVRPYLGVSFNGGHLMKTVIV